MSNDFIFTFLTHVKISYHHSDVTRNTYISCNNDCYIHLWTKYNNPPVTIVNSNSRKKGRKIYKVRE